MSFKTLDIKFSYETGNGDPINEFYVPVLTHAIKYDRIAGYFSSSSLAVAARGIAGLIVNGGKMRIIASPHLSEADINVIKKAVVSPQIYVENKLINELNNIEDELQRNHLEALGWMLAKGLLEIKLAFVIGKDAEHIDETALFHQKIGILYDKEENQLSFSGSINETASGWLNNIEEFKVFKSWETGQNFYLVDDVYRFESFWNEKRFNVKVIDISNAVKDKLIQIGTSFDKEDFITKKYIIKLKKNSVAEKLSLFFYQKNALDEWKNNNFNLLFEMATGTGKTRTAIACIFEAMKIEKKLITIISCPQGTLSKQWKHEIEEIGLTTDQAIIVDGTNKKWRNELEKYIKQISVGYNDKLIIYTTHATCSCKDFIDIILFYGKYTPICFVGDEAHGLGANIAKKGLLDIYKYRIGLSATPKRWFDDAGSAILTEYFGNKSFEFTIGDALSTINPITNKPFLVNYYYHPIFVQLTDDEFEGYHKLSTRIKKMSIFSKNSDEYHKKLESLLFARANIEKNAVNKYAALEKILNGYKDIKDTIIFTSDEQIDNVLLMLSSKSIIAHRFTQAEGTSVETKYYGKSERQYLIHKFKDGTYQALVAIKCLDEGIDIPSASTAIIMASSTNPREYIQRIGRVIRQAKGKTRAHIFDFILEPNIDRLKNPEFVEFEKKIFTKEMNRVEDMSTNAINNAEVMLAISERLRGL
jgi:superfamily II DNA or RNA helicase